MSDRSVHGLILAAGKGTRMYSETPKVLVELLGEPMLHYVYEALEGAFSGRIWTVVGHKSEMVENAFPDRRNGFILQAEQLGTGHALQTAWDRLEDAGATHCLVVNGDTPLLPVGAVRKLLAESDAVNADLSFLSITLDDPGLFGRVVRGEGGAVRAVIEAKDYDSSRYGAETGEINAGIYLLNMKTMAGLLGKLKNENNSGEFYITDLIGMAVDAKLSVLAVNCGTTADLMGINNTEELIRAEERLRRRIVTSLIRSGVLIRMPDSVVVGPQVKIRPGVSITGPCEIYGTTELSGCATVASHCVISDAVLNGCEVKNFSSIEQAVVHEGAAVGPYVRLRPGAVVGENAKAGNFVEMKKAELKAGAKASHLTYLGDAEVGEGTNIGAGTITCNYDGTNKHRTVIGKEAFIGSNTALVAPVNVGDNALIGAGSTITKNVDRDEIGIGRARQTNMRRRKSGK